MPKRDVWPGAIRERCESAEVIPISRFAPVRNRDKALSVVRLDLLPQGTKVDA